jgi:hypothetical protein
MAMAMQREGGLLAWQWRNYSAGHRDRFNLLLHMVAVPAFIAGVLAMMNLAWHRLWLGAAFAAGFTILAFAVQGLGHRRERQAPVPFAGPGNVLARVFAEQFITFPRFVLSGGWLRNLAQAQSD